MVQGSDSAHDSAIVSLQSTYPSVEFYVRDTGVVQSLDTIVTGSLGKFLILRFAVFHSTFEGYFQQTT